MTATSLTHFVAAATTATRTMPGIVSAGVQTSLRGNDQTLAGRCVR